MAHGGLAVGRGYIHITRKETERSKRLRKFNTHQKLFYLLEKLNDIFEVQSKSSKMSDWCVLKNNLFSCITFLDHCSAP